MVGGEQVRREDREKSLLMNELSSEVRCTYANVTLLYWYPEAVSTWDVTNMLKQIWIPVHLKIREALVGGKAFSIPP